MQWFRELSRGRGSSGFGPNPLSWSDLEAWAARMGRNPAPWEVGALFMLDEAWCRIAMAESLPPLTDTGDVDRNAIAANVQRAMEVLKAHPPGSRAM